MQPHLATWHLLLNGYSWAKTVAHVNEASAPANIHLVAPAVTTDLVADGVSILESVISKGYPATMAITAVPAALSTERLAVLSVLPSVAH